MARQRYSKCSAGNPRTGASRPPTKPLKRRHDGLRELAIPMPLEREAHAERVAALAEKDPAPHQPSMEGSTVGAAIADVARRPSDLAARYGGEEFAILLPDTNEAGAALIADRIHQAILGLGIRHEANANEFVTINARLRHSPVSTSRQII